MLLVDDMVDSRSTFAVLAWKLLHGGAGPVFPFALADTSADDGEKRVSMNGELSVDTEAVLLLCGRLGKLKMAGPGPERRTVQRAGTLASRQGNAAWGTAGDPWTCRLAESDSADLRKEALEPLLDRGAALGIVTARWASRGLWVLSRGDDEYPAGSKRYLGRWPPPAVWRWRS